MNKRQALKVDKSFYVDYDEDSGLFCVFGDNSGFAYFAESTKEQATEKLEEFLEQRKAK